MNYKLLVNIATLFVSVIMNSQVLSQNCNNDNPYIYYNLFDTINTTQQSTIEVPLMDIVDSSLLDSLIQYIHSIEKNDFIEIDSNGIFFHLSLGYHNVDTTHIMVYIATYYNYHMFDYEGGRAYDHLNLWRPENYKKFLYGCALCEGYLICISTDRTVNMQELSRFVRPQKETMTLRLFESPGFKEIFNTLPNKLYYMDMVNPNNYVSPVFPR